MAATLEPLVSPITGIVSAIAAGDALHIFNAVQAYRGSVDHRANRRAGKPGSASSD